MQIVLPGALPDPREARELLPHLLKAAPNLAAWLQRSRANRIVADPAQTYCMAWEHWQIQHHGFKPEPGQYSSAGLGPILAKSVPDDEPVWLIELTHISPSRDGAILIPAADLAITQEHSDALLDSALPLFADTGFSVDPCTATHWRVQLPEGYRPDCPSPRLVSTTTLNDWWSQDLADRPWRRLANELQMLWFDHPVNQQRYEQEQVPVNNVWLFGGARPSQFTTPPNATLPGMQTDMRLLEPMLRQDWSHWLQVIGTLDTELFTSLGRHSHIILAGRDQIVHYTTDNRFWMHWLPGTKESWKKWWSPQN